MSEVLLDDKRKILSDRLRDINYQRHRRFVKYTGTGLGIGFLIYFLYMLWQLPLSDTWGTAILTGIFVNIITSGFPLLWAWLTDESKILISKAEQEQINNSRNITIDVLSKYSKLEDWTFVDEIIPNLETLIFRKWDHAVDMILETIVLEHFKVQHGSIVDLDNAFRKNKEKYISNVLSLTSAIELYFKNIDKNLDAISQVSAGIRDEAILPSFEMFENRMKVLTTKHKKLTKLQLT